MARGVEQTDSCRTLNPKVGSEKSQVQLLLLSSWYQNAELTIQTALGNGSLATWKSVVGQPWES